MKPWTWRGALLAPANVAGALAATLGAIWVPHPAPLLAWLAVEGMYLAAGAWQSSRTSARRPGPAVPASWERLAPSQREQYRALRELRARVEENLSGMPGGRALEAMSQPRLDALLDDFARLLHTLNHHREFLATADPDGTRAERDGLAEELAQASTEADSALREVKQRRLDILEQRLARIAQVRGSREVVAHELAAIEDLVRLTYEQSVAVRDPAQASEALAALSEQARAAEETLRELERFRDSRAPRALALRRSRLSDQVVGGRGCVLVERHDAAAADKRVLVVDDEPQVGAVLRRLLRREGFQVSVAISAEEALNQVETLQPDLVVTDFGMAGMDGVQLLHEITRLRPGTPGIVVSGRAEPTLMSGLEGWQYAFLPKPWVDVELLGTIRRLLRHKA